MDQIGSTNAINTTFYQKLNFNFIRDIAPVSSITRQPQAMLANPLFAAKTIPEFIDYAKANPGKVNMSSPGIGTISHLAGELFKLMAGVNLVHVPFGGNGPALTALLGDKWMSRSPLFPRRLSTFEPASYSGSRSPLQRARKRYWRFRA